MVKKTHKEGTHVKSVALSIARTGVYGVHGVRRSLRLSRLFGLFRSFGLGGLVEHNAGFDVRGKGLS